MLSKTFLGSFTAVLFGLGYAVSVQACGPADYALTKSGPPQVNIGDVAVYSFQLTVKYSGGTVYIDDPVHPGYEFDPSHTTPSGAYGGLCQLWLGKVRCSFGIRGLANTTIPFQIGFRVTDRTQCGEVRNVAVALPGDSSYDTDPSDNTAEAVTTVSGCVPASSPPAPEVTSQPPSIPEATPAPVPSTETVPAGVNLHLEKTDDRSSNITHPLHSFKYTLKVKNEGDVTLDDVVVKDTVPGELQIDRESATAGAVFSGQTITWSHLPLTAGKTKVLQFKVKVKADVVLKSICNTATASSARYKLNRSSKECIQIQAPVKGKSIVAATLKPVPITAATGPGFTTLVVLSLAGAVLVVVGRMRGWRKRTFWIGGVGLLGAVLAMVAAMSSGWIKSQVSGRVSNVQSCLCACAADDSSLVCAKQDRAGNCLDYSHRFNVPRNAPNFCSELVSSVCSQDQGRVTLVTDCNPL